MMERGAIVSTPCCSSSVEVEVNTYLASAKADTLR